MNFSVDWDGPGERDRETEKWEVRTPLRWGTKLEKTFDNEADARKFADQLLLSLDLDTVQLDGRVFYVQSDDDDN